MNASAPSAMCDGTGLKAFSKRFPTRFFDVGIAEEHEIAFAGGLAASGLIPVCAVYSTFAQRTYDQLIHDVSLQRLPLVLALDRAGIVPGDGETHQGVFDCAFLSEIPYTEIYAPASFAELAEALKRAVASPLISAVRYPKGGESSYDRSGFVPQAKDAFSVCDDFVENSAESAPTLVMLTYGALTADVYRAAARLHRENDVSVRIVKLFRVHPIAEVFDALHEALDGADALYFAEEGIRSGGVGERLFALFAEHGGLPSAARIHALPDSYLPHGSVQSVKARFALDENGLVEDVQAFLTASLSKESNPLKI